MPRLFVALELPEKVRDPLGRLRGGVPGAKWLPTEQLHLTLHFIGEVDRALFQEIHSTLANVSIAPFTITLRSVGQFPPRGQPRVLWAGVVENELLTQLHAQLGAALRSQGFVPERRNFSPHVTIARFKSRPPTRHLREFIVHHSLFTSNPFVVGSFELFSSHLTTSGPQYIVEASYPFDTKKF